MATTPTPRDVVGEAATRSLRLGEHFDTREALRNAKRQAQDRDLARMLIVDVDAHHYETESWAEIVDYLEDPVMQHLARSSGLGRLNGSQSPLLPLRSATRISPAGSSATRIGVWSRPGPMSTVTR